ncbi:unnamed protein product [Choristocarpus tenellus]
MTSRWQLLTFQRLLLVVPIVISALLGAWGSWGREKHGNSQDDINRTSIDWQVVEDTEGVRTLMHRVPGSHVIAFRGETVVDEHISQLYTAFLDTSLTLEWVRFLVEVKEHDIKGSRRSKGVTAINGPHVDLIYQKYDMPWPVRDRDIVLQRTIQIDKKAKSMHATYHSTEHPLHPVYETVVRAQVHWTSWLLSAVEDGRTRIEFETQTDPRGSLPGSIVAFMQKSFPKSTMRGFVGSARGSTRHPVMAKW